MTDHIYQILCVTESKDRINQEIAKRQKKCYNQSRTHDRILL